MIASDLKPYKKAKVFDLRITDNKHVVAIDISANKMSVKEIQEVIAQSGAEEVNEKSFD